MGFLSFFRGSASPKSSMTYNTPSVNMGVRFSPSNVSELVSTYFTCVKILTDNFGQLTPMVVDAEGKKLDSHYLNAIIGRRPNAYSNRQKFGSQAEYNRAARGNALVYIERSSSGYVKALHNIPSEAIISALVSDSGGLYYRINFNLAPLIGMSNTLDIPEDDICHFQYAANGTVFSESPATVLQSYTDLLSTAGVMINNFLANNATSGLAIETTLPNAALAKEVNKSTEGFMAKYTGIPNAGKVIEVPYNSKLVNISQKYSDSQLIENQAFAKGQVVDLYQIPKFMFAGENSDLSIEQQTLQFLRFTISPILEKYKAEYEDKLLTSQEMNKGIHFEFNTDVLLNVDLKTKAEVIALQVSKGLMSPSDGAVKMGNPAIESPYGQFHFIQTQNQPIEEYNLWSDTAPDEPNTEENEEDNED